MKQTSLLDSFIKKQIVNKNQLSASHQIIDSAKKINNTASQYDSNKKENKINNVEQKFEPQKGLKSFDIK